jgi:phosphate-selective porin OprO/OprP
MKSGMRLLQALGLVLLASLANFRMAAAQDVGDDRILVRSPGGAYELAISGLAQIDGRLFAEGSGDDRFLIRRARLTFDVNAGERIALRIRPESSNGDDVRIVDAYLETRLSESLSLRVGRFKPPVGLERLQSASDLRRIERSFVTELVPSRDVGIQLSGNLETLTWAFGLFNGVADGRAEDIADDGDPEADARIFFEPLDRSATGGALFGLGLGMTFGRRDGDASDPLLVAYRSPGQVPMFSYRTGDDGTYAAGDRLRLSPHFYWFRGPLGLTGEWARVRQDVARPSSDRAATLEHEAWQLTAEWFITGEGSGYSDPDRPGALQLVARVSGMDLDAASFNGDADSFVDPRVSVSTARSAAVGVNWFPLPGLKSSLVYQHTAFDGASNAADRPDERLLLVRLQQQF